jgi:hypothetical protein
MHASGVETDETNQSANKHSEATPGGYKNGHPNCVAEDSNLEKIITV